MHTPFLLMTFSRSCTLYFFLTSHSSKVGHIKKKKVGHKVHESESVGFSVVSDSL